MTIFLKIDTYFKKNENLSIDELIEQFLEKKKKIYYDLIINYIKKWNVPEKLKKFF